MYDSKETEVNSTLSSDTTNDRVNKLTVSIWCILYLRKSLKVTSLPRIPPPFPKKQKQTAAKKGVTPHVADSNWANVSVSTKNKTTRLGQTALGKSSCTLEET